MFISGEGSPAAYQVQRSGDGKDACVFDQQFHAARLDGCMALQIPLASGTDQPLAMHASPTLFSRRAFKFIVVVDFQHGGGVKLFRSHHICHTL